MPKKPTIIIFALVLAVVLGYGVYFVYTNTSLFRPGPTADEIYKNNFNTTTNTNSDTSSPTPATNDETVSVDVTTLVPQQLMVPDKYRDGVFAIARTINMPSSFSIQVYAAGLNAPRFFTFDAANNLIVADKGAATIVLLPDIDSDGIAEDPIVIDRGLQGIHSVFYYNGDLYAGEEDTVSVYRDIQVDGSYSSKETLVSGLPSGSGHSTRTVVIGPDKRMYVSIGSSCNVCEESDARRASVVRYNLDGSGEEVFASGLRNSVGIMFHDGELWSVDNGRDRIGDDIPPEEVNVLSAGRNYGWPYCYGAGVVNPEYAGSYDEYCTNTEYPRYEMQAHSAPLGISFVTDNDSFPDALNNMMLIGFHGSWNRTIPTGYKIVRIDISQPAVMPVNFATGWLDADGTVWGRPVDVGFDHDGVLFISDDTAGALYRVTYQPDA